MSDHELRFVLNNELHGRPGLPVKAPARVTHLAYTLTATDADPLVHVSQLFQKFEKPIPVQVRFIILGRLPMGFSSLNATASFIGLV